MPDLFHIPLIIYKPFSAEYYNIPKNLYNVILEIQKLTIEPQIKQNKQKLKEVSLIEIRLRINRM